MDGRTGVVPGMTRIGVLRGRSAAGLDQRLDPVEAALDVGHDRVEALPRAVDSLLRARQVVANPLTALEGGRGPPDPRLHAGGGHLAPALGPAPGAPARVAT